MKVLFLDIDGVLNSTEWVMGEGRRYGHPPTDNEVITTEVLRWNPASVQQLKRVIDATEAMIVISSSWRGYGAYAIAKWQNMFACYGWDKARIIGETIHLHHKGRTRGDEVAEWLARHPVTNRYACVDDDSDFYPFQNLVQTTHAKGLTDKEADTLISLLNQNHRGDL